MRRRPPRRTLLPCTTLFRSDQHLVGRGDGYGPARAAFARDGGDHRRAQGEAALRGAGDGLRLAALLRAQDRKSTRLNSSHANISYAVFCLKKTKEHTSA